MVEQVLEAEQEHELTFGGHPEGQLDFSVEGAFVAGQDEGGNGRVLDLGGHHAAFLAEHGRVRFGAHSGQVPRTRTVDCIVGVLRH